MTPRPSEVERRPRFGLVALALTTFALAVPGGTALSAENGGEAPQILLQEIAGLWGLDFQHNFGKSGEMYMVETMVGGLVVFDYDLDGDQDVLFVDGGILPGYEGPAPKTRLFRNEGAGPEGLSFVDVTGRAGIDYSGYGCGAVSGDVDGDGDLDLYLTSFGANVFYRNQGDGTFEDATSTVGLADSSWSASAAFSDVDRDGDLDLYLVNYADFAIDNHKFCGDQETGIRGYCHPDSYNGVQDRFFRNRGDGTFVDETDAAGFGGEEEAGLGVVFGDVDGDGWPDLYVANDKDPNLLYLNKGDGTFEELGLLSGTAYDRNGLAEAGMGVEMADLDGDLKLDLFVTNFALETNGYYKNSGAGVFLDHRFAARLAEASLHKLAFGASVLDVELDGDLDLVVGNGHILPNAAELSPVKEYEMPNQLFENLGRGVFRERADIGMDEVRVTRGSAVGDLDLDGDQEILFINSNQVAEVYDNRSSGGRSVVFDLRSATGNTLAVDARVVLTIMDRDDESQQLRHARTASSYLSQSEVAIHFGVGSPRETARVVAEITWPEGGRTRLLDLPIGRRLLVVE